MAITQVSNSLVKQDLTISGGTVDNTVIGSGTPAAGTFTTIAGTLASTVTGTTAAASDNSTKIATTAYVTTALANLVDSAPGTLNTLNELAAALGDDASFSTTVTNSIAAKAALAGATFSGDISAPNIKATSEFQIFAGGTDIGAIFNSGGALTIQGTSTRDVSIGSDSNTNAIFIEGSDGNVGIGTNSPGSYFSKNLVVAADSDSTGGITIVNGAVNGNNYLAFADGTSGAAAYAGYVAYGHGSSGENLFFGAGGSTKMILDSNGNVGIGAAADTTGFGGTFKYLGVNGGTGMGIFNGQTSSVTANQEAAAFFGSTTGSSGYKLLGGMQVINEVSSSSNAEGAVRFFTASGGSIFERMRINRFGDPIFTGGSSATLEVRAPTDNAFISLYGGYNDSGAEEAGIIMFQNTTAKWQIANTTANQFRIYNYAQTQSAFTISSGGIASLGNASHADDVLYLTRSNDGNILRFFKSSTDLGAISTNAGALVLKGASTSAPVQLQTHDGNEDIEVDPDGFIKFEASGSERVRIDADGIKFNGDTAAANGLDDYEEGNWTPSVQSTGSATFQNASYTKVGRLVTAHCIISSIGNTSASQTFAMSLPFPPAAGDRAVTLGSITTNVAIELEGGYLTGGGVLYLYANSTGAYRPLKHQDFTSSSAIYVAFTYMST